MDYENILIREQTEGPVRWCSICERDAEDCVCEQLSDHFREVCSGGNTGEDVCVPASPVPPAQWEKAALAEIDSVRIQNETFSKILGRFQQ